MTPELDQPDCYSCRHQASADPAPREDIVHTEHWQVAHAFNSTLPGWLVVVPFGHVTSYADLSPAAADELGGLIHRLTVALGEVTGCTKTYQMQFSEAEGFSHLHVHVVPRMPDQPADRRGPTVFGYLDPDESRWLPEAERDAFALRLREVLDESRESPG